MPPLLHLARRLINVRREQQLRSMWSHFVRVRHHSCADNVYHCCVWKTASQWLRNVLSSTDIYRYSGLLAYAYEHHEGRDDRSLQVRTFDHPFPLKRIVSPLYINYESFEKVPKLGGHRVFFVVRDPRDLVVSHYFSSKYSHLVSPGVLDERARLEGLSESEGMAVHMRYMSERGIFDALRSWVQHATDDERIRIFRFEDLVGNDQTRWMRQLMDHCDISIPQENLETILSRLSFTRLSGGRKPGQENKHHKYRSGKAGDWKRYFDEGLSQTFNEVTGDVHLILGYQ